MDTTDQPNSIVQLTTIENDDSTILPFNLLAGETRSNYGRSVDGIILLTNYRLYIQNGQYHHYHIPLGLIEIVEHRDIFYLHIGCKDARTYRCTFDNNENCLKWFDLISKAIESPCQLNVIFAFYYFIYSKDQCDDGIKERIQNLKRYNYDRELFNSEMNRLGFKGDSWRISDANIEFKLCQTYPPYIIVPSCINDIKLESVAKFRSSRRIPAVVWRHINNGAVIARCSQPEVGWLGWRSSEDEGLIQAISDACNFDQNLRNNINHLLINNDKDTILLNTTTTTSGSSISSDDSSLQITDDNNLNKNDKKVLIMDARSYTTAVANRARGGGCECPEYYPNCEIQFMNLANIHSIRKSFHAVRLLCTQAADQPNWFSQLENTRWLQHMSGLMKAAVTLVNAIEREARPVLVHCSDGWDRTSQIVALAELLLDPFYRTIDGFRILIEREWLAYGHKFADRCGHTPGNIDQNERCPVFLQWLDCIHQLLIQFPCAFEFSHKYLIKLTQHIYSNLYGTFLCNTYEERLNYVNCKTFSVWDFLNNITFKNHLYTPTIIGNNYCDSNVLWPQCNVRDLQLWNEVYLGTWEINFNSKDYGIIDSCPIPSINNHNLSITTTTTTATTTTTSTTSSSSPQHMTKTRSYGDLINDITITTMRRSSDPSINIDKKLTTTTTTHEEQQQQQQDIISLNGHINTDCSNDCIYINTKIIDEIDGYSNSDNNDVDDDDNNSDFLHEHVINSDNKTDICHLNNGLLTTTTTTTMINDHNGNNNECDSDNDCEISESKSENTICFNDLILNNHKSIETSTDTLIATDNLINYSSSPIELINGFEKLQTPNDDDVDDDDNIDIINNDGCKVCAQNLKFVNDTQTTTTNQNNYYNNISNKKDDNCCNSNYNNLSSNRNSRTTSTSSWDNNYYINQHQQQQQQQHLQPQQQQFWQTHFNNLGDDGLVPVRSIAQERLYQIIQEHKRKEELLEKELHTYRQALINQFCHKCCNNDNDKVDDAGSIVESLCSVGDGQISVGCESIRSDLSWENLEENRLLPECTTTLWVPDHAVDRCMGCQTMFWAGRRKHHCRKCGNIFCASCSEYTTPLPSEQLFNPVRVCSSCYTKLHRDSGNNCDLLLQSQITTTTTTTPTTTQEQCKQQHNHQRQQQQHHHHHHHHQTNTNRQITASSN